MVVERAWVEVSHYARVAVGRRTGSASVFCTSLTASSREYDSRGVMSGNAIERSMSIAEALSAAGNGEIFLKEPAQFTNYTQSNPESKYEHTTSQDSNSNIPLIIVRSLWSSRDRNETSNIL